MQNSKRILIFKSQRSSKLCDKRIVSSDIHVLRKQPQHIMIVFKFIDFFGQTRCGLCFVDDDQTTDPGILRPLACILDSSHSDHRADLLELAKEVTPGTDCIDLLHSNPETNTCMYTTQDVEAKGRAEIGHPDSVDLIDFGSDNPPPLPSVPGDGIDNQAVKGQSPIAFDHKVAGNRDSAISSGSSTRTSCISCTSTRSSGIEFTKDCIVVDSGHGDIAEEGSELDLFGLEHLPAPDNNFRNRTSVINDQEKRQSKLSSRGSTSSGTITGFQGEGSNRDSQASFLSFDAEFPPRSGSSSTADDEHELSPREKKPSRASSLRRHFRGRKKTKGQGCFDGQDNLNNEQSGKKEKGFFGMIRTRRSKDKTKASGSKVYKELAEKTLDAFDIIDRMAHPEVEEKTPRGTIILGPAQTLNFS